MKTILMILTFLLITATCHAVSSNGFVLNVVLDGSPVNEIAGNEVAIPFNSEYKLRIKNNNNRRCTVRITIDGAKVSMLGDLILSPNGEIDLERFIDQSLESGKRFKFVSLDHPDVDDPSRAENGEIVAEFRLEKENVGIAIEPPWYFPYENYRDDNYIDTPCSNLTLLNTSANMLVSNAQPGATVGGAESSQRFVKRSIDVEEKIYKLSLKIVGLSLK